MLKETVEHYKKGGSMVSVMANLNCPFYRIQACWGDGPLGIIFIG